MERKTRDLTWRYASVRHILVNNSKQIDQGFVISLSGIVDCGRRSRILAGNVIYRQKITRYKYSSNSIQIIILLSCNVSRVAFYASLYILPVLWEVSSCGDLQWNFFEGIHNRPDICVGLGLGRCVRRVRNVFPS